LRGACCVRARDETTGSVTNVIALYAPQSVEQAKDEGRVPFFFGRLDSTKGLAWKKFTPEARAGTNLAPRVFVACRNMVALDALDELCDSKEFRVDMRLEPGDIQWLHNHTTLHARSAYSCVGKEMSERHLLRLWLTPFSNARELPPMFAERFGDLTPGPTRGGIRVDGQKPYCALEPGA